jgi:hypothetical protein
MSFDFLLRGDSIMKFNNSKIISMLLIGLCFLGFSKFANADDLKVSNDSKYNLSFSVNNVCSKDFGVVDNHSVKVISDANFKKACAYNSSNCEAKVYNAASCTGKQVAAIVFDTSYGVQGLYPTGITTKGNGFNLFFEGPWLAK